MNSALKLAVTFGGATFAILIARASVAAPLCSQILLTPRELSLSLNKSLEDLARLKISLDSDALRGHENAIEMALIAEHFPVVFQKFIQESGLNELEVKKLLRRKISEIQKNHPSKNSEARNVIQKKTEALSISFEPVSSEKLSFAISSTNGFFEFLPDQNILVARALMIAPILGNKIGAATVIYDLTSKTPTVIQEKSQLAIMLLDRKTVLSLGADGKLIYFDTVKGDVVRSIQTDLAEEMKVESWALSPDGNMLAFNRKNQIVVMDLDSGKIISESFASFLNSPGHAKQMRFSGLGEVIVHDSAKGLARFNISDGKIKFIVSGDFATAVFNEFTTEVMLVPYMSTKHPGVLLDIQSNVSQELTQHLAFAKNIEGTTFHFARSYQGKYHTYGIYPFGIEHPIFEIDRPELIGEWSGPKGVEITGVASKGDHLILFHRERSNITSGTLEFYRKN